MARKFNVERATRKWGDNLLARTEDMRESVEELTVNPAEKAIENLELMKARWLEAYEKGKIKGGLSKVTLDYWKKQYINKGLSNIRTGVENAKDKVKDFLSDLFEYQKKYLAEIDRIKKVNREASRARMLKWFDIMSNYQYKK